MGSRWVVCPSARGLDLFLPPWPLGWLVTHSENVIRWDPEHKERERPGVWRPPVQTIGRPTPPRETCRTPAGAPRTAGLQGAEPQEGRPAENSVAPAGCGRRSTAGTGYPNRRTVKGTHHAGGSAPPAPIPAETPGEPRGGGDPGLWPPVPRPQGGGQRPLRPLVRALGVGTG